MKHFDTIMRNREEARRTRPNMPYESDDFKEWIKTYNPGLGTVEPIKKEVLQRRYPMKRKSTPSE